MVSKKYQPLLLVMLLFVGLFGVSFTTQVQTQGTVDALILVADSFGLAYFDARDTLVSWGVDVTTIGFGLDTTIASCINHPPQPITADILLSGFNLNTLSNYDCVLIPPGGHWQALSNSQAVRDFIEAAYVEGLVIGSLCIGNMVVARSNDIVDGCKVASYGQSNLAMQAAGATPITGVRVVSDNRIITGGTGGGYPTGYTTAPTLEVCVALVKAVLRRSFVRSTTLEPSPNGVGFTIAVETQDPTALLPAIPSTTIATVTAEIYLLTNPAEILQTQQLSDADHDETYTGTFSNLNPGQYQVNVEVEDSDEVLEVIQNAASSSLSALMSPIDPLLLGGLIALVCIISVAVGVIFWKRRTRT